MAWRHLAHSAPESAQEGATATSVKEETNCKNDSEGHYNDNGKDADCKIKGNKRMTEREVNAVYDSLLRSINAEVDKVKKMIADYLAAQKDLETQAEERLEQYRDKLEKVNSMRDDLKSHIQVC